MNETTDYIESYFENSLSNEERMRFEQRITTDAAFASEVAFYLQARQALRQELLVQKEKSWQQEPEAVVEKPTPVIPIRKPSLARRWMAAAAGVAITAGVSIPLLTNSLNSLQRMTASVIKEDVTHIGGEMGDTEKDRMVQAIEAYNTADYSFAAKIFDSLQTVQPDNINALQYSGQAALLLENYDTAVSRFKRLATHTEIRNAKNPGKFFEALAIIKSKRTDYKVEAKRILEEVVATQSQGWQKAQNLLKDL